MRAHVEVVMGISWSNNVDVTGQSMVATGETTSEGESEGRNVMYAVYRSSPLVVLRVRG